MSAGRTITLNSGHKIPTLGFGTWQAPPGEARTAVYEALKAGYRHLDLAKVYGNQPEIGEGIKKALDEVPGLKREDIFITSKLWNNSHQPDKVAAALDETLQELGLEYLDLYLIHWPVGFKAGADLFPKNDAGFLDIDETVTISQTWKAVSELPKTKARSVGVSNFTIEQLETVINDTGVVPAVNQIERHPRILDLPLIEYLKKKNIIVTAYSAFGNNGVGEPLIITHPDVKATAERLSAAQGKTVTPAQVILAWSQHGGHTVIPKSVTASRIAENFQQIDIDDEAIQTINKIGEKPHRFNVPYTYNPKWNVNIFGDEKEAAAETKVILKL